MLLVCFLLWDRERPHLRRSGIAGRVPHPISRAVRAGPRDRSGRHRDLPGRARDGLGVAVNPAGLDAHWWTVPVLLLAAVRAGLQEELVVVGYLFARLRDVGWGTWHIIVGSALLRGTYHLYQGFGGFVGNLVMGLIFGWLIRDGSACCRS
ncbi:MAG: CPBP family intramembrane glutamic endopeptidase [Schumannella sp.]